MRAATNKKSQRRNLAWESEPQPRRGPKPGLSTTEVARMAIRIADAEGLAAVTMQRVAAELDVTTMALYRYFPSKADLLAMMIDAAGAPVPSWGARPKSWKVRLAGWARHCMALYRKHPWLAEATTARRSIMGPVELSWMEAALALLAEAGVPPKERYFVFLTVLGHIRAHASFERLGADANTSGRWVRDLDQLLRTASGRYPTLQATLASGALDGKPDEAFEYGLDCILEGIRPPRS